LQLNQVEQLRELRRQERRGMEQQGVPAVKTSAAPERIAHHELVEVLFCTSRRLVVDVGPFEMFQGERESSGADFAGHYGIAHILVPKQRDVGQNILADRRFAGKYVSWQNEGRYRYILDDAECLKANAWQTAAAEIAQRRRAKRGHAKGPEGLVYVHGFNTRFHEAVERTAQLGTDLDIAGPIAAYSWPSAGLEKKYGEDILHSNGLHSSDLTGCILKVLDATNALVKVPNEPSSMTLIGHSLGCKFLAEALLSLAKSSESRTDKLPFISEVIFASPAELTSSALVEMIERTASIVDRFTVYCSYADSALAWRYLRGWLSDKPIAGADRVELARLVAERGLRGRVDIIETSAVTNRDSGLKGHSDYATSAIDDLRMKLWFAPQAAARELLLDGFDDKGGALYWQVRKLDDRASRSKRLNPLHLTIRAAARQALEDARVHGSIEAAIHYHARAFKAPELAGAAGKARQTYHQQLIDVLNDVLTVQHQQHVSVTEG
jgi:esterase/lipase superfamily enzyme